MITEGRKSKQKKQFYFLKSCSKLLYVSLWSLAALSQQRELDAVTTAGGLFHPAMIFNETFFNHHKYF